MFILQNAIEIKHNGNLIILNSRYTNFKEEYISGNVNIWIVGGKYNFQGIYENDSDFVEIKDLRLTYDSPFEEIQNKLLWADHSKDQKTFTWRYIKTLSVYKLQRIIEEQINMNPLVLRVIKDVYCQKKSKLLDLKYTRTK